ncbi:MAG: hypothetical protein NQ127_00950 [Candidatus Cardinium sp.]|nr:hypothetical protein [Candidatus Cardinium sp.]
MPIAWQTIQTVQARGSIGLQLGLRLLFIKHYTCDTLYVSLQRDNAYSKEVVQVIYDVKIQ